jgi:hypothetical protein
MPKQELESAIVGRIQKRLKETGGWFIKVHGGAFQAAGVPDIIGCLSGRFVAFEVKRPSGKPTKLQLYVIGRIQAAGGLAAVVYSVADVETALKADKKV